MADKKIADKSRSGLPFPVEEREQVTKVRKRDAHSLRHPNGKRTQAMKGFEEQYLDIVDYIVRITDEIWVDRAMGRIYDTYDHSCTIYSSYGVVRSVEEVMASTAATLNGFPDGEAHFLNVAWAGNETEGFYTSHLGFSRSTNLGASMFGPATGKRVNIRFCADCISLENRIHTEWLVRDNGALVRQLGFNIHDVAQKIAQHPLQESQVVSVPTRMIGQVPRRALETPENSLQGYFLNLYHNIWNLRRFDLIDKYYSSDMVCHSSGGRVAIGKRNYSALLLLMLTALPDATISVEKITYSEETDGLIVAVRWVLSGSTRKGGMLGDVPELRPINMMGMSHHRFVGDKIVEEWMLFDEVGVLASAYRQDGDH
ncbi:nuclear transport factor 2 family protein [Alteromonas oceanisediminis]|uniref:nuclear transport factor 2 family protein n=1 Tax=Alteromonas oceanisediminis TaxID=2836180 RepID=UPI001BDA35DA|nr:ester cyclase [Alteromonas oceanisediminis]MBT0585588.1 ester cyclase [Alteromonas oceanisediminis]